MNTDTESSHNSSRLPKSDDLSNISDWNSLAAEESKLALSYPDNDRDLHISSQKICLDMIKKIFPDELVENLAESFDRNDKLDSPPVKLPKDVNKVDKTTLYDPTSTVGNSNMSSFGLYLSRVLSNTVVDPSIADKISVSKGPEGSSLQVDRGEKAEISFNKSTLQVRDIDINKTNNNYLSCLNITNDNNDQKVSSEKSNYEAREASMNNIKLCTEKKVSPNHIPYKGFNFDNQYQTSRKAEKYIYNNFLDLNSSNKNDKTKCVYDMKSGKFCVEVENSPFHLFNQNIFKKPDFLITSDTNLIVKQENNNSQVASKSFRENITGSHFSNTECKTTNLSVPHEDKCKREPIDAANMVDGIFNRILNLPKLPWIPITTNIISSNSITSNTVASNTVASNTVASNKDAINTITSFSITSNTLISNTITSTTNTSKTIFGALDNIHAESYKHNFAYERKTDDLHVLSDPIYPPSNNSGIGKKNTRKMNPKKWKKVDLSAEFSKRDSLIYNKQLYNPQTPVGTSYEKETKSSTDIMQQAIFNNTDDLEKDFDDTDIAKKASEFFTANSTMANNTKFEDGVNNFCFKDDYKTTVLETRKSKLVPLKTYNDMISEFHMTPRCTSPNLQSKGRVLGWKKIQEQTHECSVCKEGINFDELKELICRHSFHKKVGQIDKINFYIELFSDQELVTIVDYPTDRGNLKCFVH